MNIDPRVSIIEDRLESVKRIIAVTGFKGGIGKSVISVSLALALNEKGFKTGLFDMDFSGASGHIILNSAGSFPREDKGLIPPYVHGIKFMTAAYFSGDRALPLRGSSVSNAIKELLTVTIWDELDFLIMDMPPGINDTALDVIKLVKKAEILPVQIPSKISEDVLKRSIEIYRELGIKITGTVENMSASSKPGFYSQIFYDKALEKTLGCPEKIMKTCFYGDVLKLALKVSRTSKMSKREGEREKTRLVKQNGDIPGEVKK